VNGKSGVITTRGENPPFVPEGMKALEIVKRLREAKSPLALVMDEFGSIAGMITLTDVLEAIVGDIPSASDEMDEPEAVQREDGSWLVDGVMAAEELQMILDIDELPYVDANYDTVGGFVMSYLGHMPAAGDHFEWNGLRFEVMDMDGLRVDKVLVNQIYSQQPG
jgi:putative hemolysin